MSISHDYLAFISQKQLSVTIISITSCGWGDGLWPTRAQAIAQTQDVPHFQTHFKTNSIPYSVLNKPLNGTNKQRLIANSNKQLNNFKQTINSLTVLCDLGDHKPAHNASCIRTSIATNVMGSHNSTQVGCHGFSRIRTCLPQLMAGVTPRDQAERTRFQPQIQPTEGTRISSSSNWGPRH